MTRFFGTAGFLLAQSNKIHFVWCGAILPMLFAEADSGYKAASAVTGVLAAATLRRSTSQSLKTSPSWVSPTPTAAVR